MLRLKEGGCLLEFLKLDWFFYLSSENKDTDKLGNLICGFVFECAKSRFYPDAAQFKDKKAQTCDYYGLFLTLS